ncbi:MAG: cation:proton antiporter [Clostridium sp.]|uniref:cation:proton antiporter n=1 Tax=Clostridium sp. TaxID=1506 RepID=UPI0025C7171E|nr:cation:proton antiporter [Clostridium sp.]MBS5926953.1 cation:proton antiporter [Clostridium sp.]
MLSYRYLFDIALILLSTKVLGIVTKKFQMPQVVGALLAGLILGPAVFNIIAETDFIKQIAELGVIVIMFTAGLSTDINELKSTGKASFIVALCGVILPLIGGTIVAYIFNRGELAGVYGNEFIENIFIGIILTATSVSITVETLKELGKLNVKTGNAILGAALIDDILGIIALTIVTSFNDASVSVILVLIKIILFFILSGISGYLFYKCFDKFVNRYNSDMRRFIIAAFVFCLLLSFVAERFFGVADITGAFIAGLVLSNNKETSYINARFETLSYMLLSPIFFASIGLKVSLSKMSLGIILFTICIVGIGIITKVIGCGLGAKLCGFNNKEALQVGVGMVARGEVALVVANKGISMGIMNPIFLAPIIILVVVCAITTPIILKIVYKDKNI